MTVIKYGRSPWGDHIISSDHIISKAWHNAAKHSSFLNWFRWSQLGSWRSRCIPFQDIPSLAGFCGCTLFWWQKWAQCWLGLTRKLSLQKELYILSALSTYGPVHTGRGAPRNMPTLIMKHIVVNGSVHTACKQHKRVCMQMCLRVLCERALRSVSCAETIWQTSWYGSDFGVVESLQRRGWWRWQQERQQQQHTTTIQQEQHTITTTTSVWHPQVVFIPFNARPKVGDRAMPWKWGRVRRIVFTLRASSDPPPVSLLVECEIVSLVKLVSVANKALVRGDQLPGWKACYRGWVEVNSPQGSLSLSIHTAPIDRGTFSDAAFHQGLRMANKFYLWLRIHGRYVFRFGSGGNQNRTRT